MSGISTIYRIRPGLHYIFHNQIGYLIGEMESYSFNDKCSPFILSHVNGSDTDDIIAGKLNGVMDETLVYFNLMRLSEGGFITAIADSFGHSNPPCLVSKDIKYNQMLNAIGAATVEVHGVHVDSSFLNRVKNEIDAAGFNAPGLEKKNTIEIIVCNDYLDDGVAEAVEGAMKRKNFYYPLKIAGNHIWFGPLFNPQKGPCWFCLTYRLKKNRPVQNYLKEVVSDKMLHFNSDLNYRNAQLAIPLSVTYLTKQFIMKAGHDHLIVFDPWKMTYQKHMLCKRPQCDYCGDEELYKRRANIPPEIRRYRKRYVADGGYRIVKPETTYKRLQHLISPITGIVCHLEPYKGKNHRVRPVWRGAYHVNPPKNDVRSKETFVKESFGKGATEAQARASAICEAIERYSAMYQGDEPVVRGSFEQLKSMKPVDPRLLQNFSELQYKMRDKENENRDFLVVPLPFDDRLEISWTHAWTLLSKEPRLLPLSYCYSYAPVPEHEKICTYNPNGHAAGNTFEEAILQGLLELIERDAVAVWWYNRLNFPEIDLNGFHDPYFLKVKNHYMQMGWKLWVLDLTHDLAVPVTVAIAYNIAMKHFIAGFGCHVSMHLAVQRSITEMHQLFHPTDAVSGWKENDMEHSTFMFPDPTKTTRRYSDYPIDIEQDLAGDIEYCSKKISDKGMEIIVIDHTRPDIELPTVKVVVPGLRHFWKRLGPGRLYDVPVSMGWMGSAIPEADLNPIPLMV